LLKEKNQQKDENSPNLITLSRVARFLLTYVMYGNGGKYTKLPLHILPNGHRVYQPFSFRGPPKFTQIGIFGLKIYHLATLTLSGTLWPLFDLRLSTKITNPLFKPPLLAGCPSNLKE
jgi:hypothetical protein